MSTLILPAGLLLGCGLYLVAFAVAGIWRPEPGDGGEEPEPEAGGGNG